jgi:hypothetical protein
MEVYLTACMSAAVAAPSTMLSQPLGVGKGVASTAGKADRR